MFHNLFQVERFQRCNHLCRFRGQKKIPDNKVVGVDLGSTAAVQQDPGVSHNGTAPVVLVLHGGHSWQQTVEILRDVGGAVAIKHIVDDISRLQRALQDRDVSLRIKKSENILSAEKENTHITVIKD